MGSSAASASISAMLLATVLVGLAVNACVSQAASLSISEARVKRQLFMPKRSLVLLSLIRKLEEGQGGGGQLGGVGLHEDMAAFAPRPQGPRGMASLPAAAAASGEYNPSKAYMMLHMPQSWNRQRRSILAGSDRE